MSYVRMFMPLSKEAAGYEFKGRIPAGRCIVEFQNAKGKLSLWAQDLKPETRYSVCMVFGGSDGYVGVSMGGLVVDLKGKGEMRVAFDEDGLKGLALDSLVSVAVLASAGKEIISPLCGYKDRPVMWQNRFSFVREQEEKLIVEDEKFEVVEIKPVEEKEEEIAEEIVEEIEVEIEEMVEEVQEIQEIEEAVEIEEIKQEEEIKIIDIVAVEKVEKKEILPSEPHITPDYNDAISVVENILANNPVMDPFAKLNRTAKWVRFSIADPVPMPYNRPNLLEEPFVRAAYANHGHLLLGATIDDGPKKYIIGIPSVYDPDQRPQARRLGFSQFKCNEGDRAKRGAEGYWLMFINM